MEFSVVRLDKETKVALMAALMYDGPGADIKLTVEDAIAMETAVHNSLPKKFREE